MSPEMIPWVVPILNLSVLIYLLIHSRRWTEPARAVRLESVEDDLKVLRGNFHRFERDTNETLRDVQECVQNILGEVQVIRQNGAHEHPLLEKVEALEDRVLDVEQAIHGLPCSQSKCVT